MVYVNGMRDSMPDMLDACLVEWMYSEFDHPSTPSLSQWKWHFFVSERYIDYTLLPRI